MSLSVWILNEIVKFYPIRPFKVIKLFVLSFVRIYASNVPKITIINNYFVLIPIIKQDFFFFFIPIPLARLHKPIPYLRVSLFFLYYICLTTIRPFYLSESTTHTCPIIANSFYLDSSLVRFQSYLLFNFFTGTMAISRFS